MPDLGVIQLWGDKFVLTEPASRFGIGCEYDVPDELFMALELEPDALRGRPGTIRYHAAFAKL
jgi:putative acetyltransferase